MPHPLFGPEVRLMLEENDVPAMRAFCENLHPATAAEALAENLSIEEVWKFLNLTNIKTQAAIFEYFPIDWQVKMVEGTGQPHMARLIEQMSHDDRADLLRRLMPRVTEQLLRLVDEADRRDIATLSKYPENSAGSIMTTDYAWLPANITVHEAIERLRLQAPDKETIYYIFVLDDQRKLLGVVSLRDLILAPRHHVIRDIMEQDLITVKATDDRELVAKEIARYDLLAMPVVDADNRLIGIVTHDDVIDVVVQEATEDVQRMGGVGAIPENYLEASFFRVWRKRAMWLSCLFGAELFTFTALAAFDDAIKAIVVLSLFVPLCISTGGNSGSQAATLITRALALGQVGQRDWWRVLRHELLMGLVLGLTLGTIGYVRAVLTPVSVLTGNEERKDAFRVQVSKDKGKLEPADRGEAWEYQFPPHCEITSQQVTRWDLAWVIACSVAAICLWGTLVGSMLPIVFKRLGFDPAFASSPFVATFVDVTGIVIYFSIAVSFIPALRGSF